MLNVTPISCIVLIGSFLFLPPDPFEELRVHVLTYIVRVHILQMVVREASSRATAYALPRVLVVGALGGRGARVPGTGKHVGFRRRFRAVLTPP